eukprot:TRINITY_DN1152_c0_g1_i10.p1 TRINITY_DN1152_c0_g1~~TRINITY_DN1152_c0_g1_i10.p1  ORF type:complete len:516 (-),score=128.23 TRINITY_DN1152_c0_g1_i10:193-1740(-)
MDKMIQKAKGDVIITNDGATILEKMELHHPCAKMACIQKQKPNRDKRPNSFLLTFVRPSCALQLVDLAHAQDVEAGDGTTTVTILAGALLTSCQSLLNKGIHPTVIAEGLQRAAQKAVEVLRNVADEVDLCDREALLNSAKTSLNSKVVSQYSSLLAPLAVDAVLKVIDPLSATNVDLRDIKVVKMLGGTVDDTELVEGLVFTQHASHAAGGPTRITDAKIGLIQFQLSSPKTNMEGKVIMDNYQALDRILKQERLYILNMCKQIKKTGCNVLCIQKSILRDAVSDLSLQYLAKLGIMVIKDIERDEVEFISKAIGAIPIASIEAFTAAKLGTAKLVEEISTPGGKVIFVTGVPNASKLVTIFVRGSNKLILDEADRSIHDSLCVIRSMVKERHTTVGGSAPEIEVALALEAESKKTKGMDSYIYKAFAEAFEVIPYTLAENAGLNPIAIVTDLRNKHALGNKTYGINIKQGAVSCMKEEGVIQPLLVTTSAIKLAAETVAMILKIDDVILVRGF